MKPQDDLVDTTDLEEQWDADEYKILDGVTNYKNQDALAELNAHEIGLSFIHTNKLKKVENKTSYLKMIESVYVFLLKFV